MQLADCPKCNRPHLPMLLEACGGMCPLCREKLIWEEADRSDRWVIPLIAFGIPIIICVAVAAVLLRRLA